jgi:hypothetical protein
VQDAILYIPDSNSRISWAVEEILVRRAGLKIRFAVDEADFISASAEIKIHYTRKELPGNRIYRSGFLDENGISQGFIPGSARINGLFCLFPDNQEQQFDLFAMVFWCLSRYEEYGLFSADKHGRFPSTASLLYSWGVLEEPVCDIAISAMFAQWGLTVQQNFSIIPTLDIDIAFAYAGRGWLRSLGAALKNPLSLSQRLKSMENPELDPNFSFPYIQKALKNNPNARIFWHCGAQNNRYDKQVSLDFKPLLAAIKNMDNGMQCGLHPSFAAFKDENILLKEKQFLERTLNRQVTESRMHYILLSFPRTYRSLLHAGITHDYSMGYPDTPGFRAGTAHPFTWYDLNAEQSTNLQVHPFCIMDATSRHYLQQKPEQAMGAGNLLKAIIREHGGNFCFIFHNESLGKQAEWRGWDTVFKAWME